MVRLRVLVAGLCGSDMPRLNGGMGKSSNGDFGGAPPRVVGEVIETASPLFKTSQRVVGTLGPAAILSEVVTCSATSIIAVPDGFDDAEAVAIQPVGVAPRVAEQFPDIQGRTVAVIGVGPCGLSFCHILRETGWQTSAPSTRWSGPRRPPLTAQTHFLPLRAAIG